MRTKSGQDNGLAKSIPKRITSRQVIIRKTFKNTCSNLGSKWTNPQSNKCRTRRIQIFLSLRRSNCYSTQRKHHDLNYSSKTRNRKEGLGRWTFLLLHRSRNERPCRQHIIRKEKKLRKTSYQICFLYAYDKDLLEVWLLVVSTTRSLNYNICCITTSSHTFVYTLLLDQLWEKSPIKSIACIQNENIIKLRNGNRRIYY